MSYVILFLHLMHGSRSTHSERMQHAIKNSHSKIKQGFCYFLLETTSVLWLEHQNRCNLIHFLFFFCSGNCWFTIYKYAYYLAEDEYCIHVYTKHITALMVLIRKIKLRRDYKLNLMNILSKPHPLSC